MKRLVLMLGVFINSIGIYSQTTQTFNAGSGTFTVPCGVNSITVECWGGGGAGGGTGNVTGRKGGGGGGAYARSVIAVNFGQVFTYTVGAGGTGGAGNSDGTNGTPSNFGNVVIAAAGMRSTGTNGGEGGSIVASTGTVRFAGGNGSNAGLVSSGAGGGGAGTADNGANALLNNGGAGGANNGGNGGNGATNANGTTGNVRGGGGGGAARTSNNRNGGSGGRGEIRITFTPSTTSGCSMCEAIPITSFPFTATQSNAGYNNMIVGGCNGNNDAVFGQGRDVYFSVNVAANTHLKIQLTGTNPAFWKQVGIGRTDTGLCTGQIGCHTNGAWTGGIISPTGTTESHCRNIWFPNAGTYYIVYDTDALNEIGNFTLNVDQHFPDEGDNCATAFGMNADEPVTITNTNCTFSSGIDDPTPASLFCAESIENTNWLVFQSNGNGNPVNVVVDNVACQPGYFNGASFAAPAGEFGILTSATNDCGGPYSTAVPCVDIPSGGTYVNSLPNNTVRNYYFIWDGNGGAECNYRLSVTNVSPLPVDLVYFHATYVNRTVNLNWKTASEQNNSKFIIERSSDAVNWKYLTEVSGAINSSIALTYSSIDENPLPGINYYRLLQVDLDGKITESGIAVAETDLSSISMELFPNPSKTNQSVVVRLNGIENSKTIDFQIFDIQGSKIHFSTINWDKNNPTFEINHILNPGSYFIQVQDSNGNKFTEKMIVI